MNPDRKFLATLGPDEQPTEKVIVKIVSPQVIVGGFVRCVTEAGEELLVHVNKLEAL